MGAFLRGVFLLRPTGLPDDRGKSGDEFFMNALEFDGGASNLGAISVLGSPGSDQGSDSTSLFAMGRGYICIYSSQVLRNSGNQTEKMVR